MIYQLIVNKILKNKLKNKDDIKYELIIYIYFNI